MAQHYLIIFDKNIPPEVQNEFLEVITSNYVSKKLEKFSAISISAEDEISPQEIHKNLKAKLKTGVSFIVIKMAAYFGNFPLGVFDWIKSTFPDKDYINQ